MHPPLTPRRRWSLLLLGLTLATGPALLLGGCGEGRAAPPGEPPEAGAAATRPQGVPVEVEPVVRGDVSRFVKLTGTLEAEEVAVVPAQVGGRLLEVLVEPGDPVEARQVLARLDTADVALDLQETLGELHLAERVVRQQEIALQEAQARRRQAEESETQARQDKERQETLALRGMITEETLEDARVEHQKRLLDVEAARLAVEKAQVVVEIETARAAKTRTARDRIQLRRDRHELRSPIAGTVTAVEVKAHDAVVAGQVLMTVMNTTDLELHLQVPEGAISQLTVGCPAALATESGGTELFPGRVSRINPVVDPRSGTVQVEVKVEPSGGRLRPGMFVACAIQVEEHRDVLLAPKQALVHDEGAAVLFIVGAEGQAARISLRGHRGLDDETHVEVDHPDLIEGVRVIVVGQANLKDGTLVHVVETED